MRSAPRSIALISAEALSAAATSNVPTLIIRVVPDIVIAVAVSALVKGQRLALPFCRYVPCVLIWLVEFDTTKESTRY